MKRSIIGILIAVVVLFNTSLVLFSSDRPVVKPEYVVTLELGQVSYTLDIWQHAKNAMNKIEITFPTTEEFYNSVTIGKKLNKDFKTGSFLFDGDFEKWNIVVKDKKIIQKK